MVGPYAKPNCATVYTNGLGSNIVICLKLQTFYIQIYHSYIGIYRFKHVRPNLSNQTIH